MPSSGSSAPAVVAASKDLALASKEILVLAGKFVMAEARRHGGKLLPVDSEHNAVHQCLAGVREAERDGARLVLTASGGPFLNRSYDDSALPIGCSQTISQPYTVAFMTQALGAKPGDRVLEIGTGSGYQAAVLAEIVRNTDLTPCVVGHRGVGKTAVALHAAMVAVGAGHQAAAAASTAASVVPARPMAARRTRRSPARVRSFCAVWFSIIRVTPS